MTDLIGSRVRVSLGLQLPHALHHINDAGHESEDSGDNDDKGEWKETQLQHDPRNRAHLADSGGFSGPARFYFHFISNEKMQNQSTDENYGITRDHEHGKPDRKFSVIRIALTPVADAERNDSA